MGPRATAQVVMAGAVTVPLQEKFYGGKFYQEGKQ